MLVMSVKEVVVSRVKRGNMGARQRRDERHGHKEKETHSSPPTQQPLVTPSPPAACRPSVCV